MVLHYTTKLRKKLHIPELSGADIAVGPHLRWYAHLFTAQRVQYILTTNAWSLFSFVIYGRGVTDDDAYLRQFFDALRDQLYAVDLRLIFDRVISPGLQPVSLARASDRSVLGSMNDMVRLCKGRLELEDVSPWHLGQELNATPFGAIKFRYPKDLVARWPLQDYPQ